LRSPEEAKEPIGEKFLRLISVTSRL
jgi:hypothetical protein